MLTPEQVERIASLLLDIYQRIESDLLRNVASRFSVLEGAPISGLTAWQTEKLNQLGALRAENIKVLAKYSGLTEKEVARVLTEAGYKAVEYDESVYKRAFEKGLLPTQASPLRASAGVQQILDAAISNAKQVFNLVNTTAVESAQSAFMDIVNKVYLETSLGIRSYTDAIRTAVRNLADKGIAGVTYTDKWGRTINYHVDVAVRRAILTSSSQTAGKIQLQRAKEWGSNLVEVTSHMGARPSHAEWQGKIYSIEGGTDEYPNLRARTRYGEPDGLKGVNCRHDFYPYIPGLSEQKYKPYDEEENEKVYQQSQQQRALERDIRQQKRRILAAEEIGDEDMLNTAQVKLKEKEAELKEFLEKTGRTQRPDRQQVYGFGRSEAAKATWAGRKGKTATQLPTSVSTIEDINAELIVPVNPITDQDKFKAIAYSLRTEGWKGNPILALSEGESYIALTGSHRIYAARDAGVPVKVSVIDADKLKPSEIAAMRDAMDDYERLDVIEKAYKAKRIPREQLDIMRAEVQSNEVSRNYRRGAEAYDRQKQIEMQKAVESAVRAAKEAEEQAKKEAEALAARMAGSAKAEYDAFLARMKAKYKNIWAEMTTAEMDELERLERALYKGK